MLLKTLWNDIIHNIMKNLNRIPLPNFEHGCYDIATPGLSFD